MGVGVEPPGSVRSTFGAVEAPWRGPEEGAGKGGEGVGDAGGDGDAEDAGHYPAGAGTAVADEHVVAQRPLQQLGPRNARGADPGGQSRRGRRGWWGRARDHARAQRPEQKAGEELEVPVGVPHDVLAPRAAPQLAPADPRDAAAQGAPQRPRLQLLCERRHNASTWRVTPVRRGWKWGCTTSAIAPASYQAAGRGAILAPPLTSRSMWCGCFS